MILSRILYFFPRETGSGFGGLGLNGYSGSEQDTFFRGAEIEQFASLAALFHDHLNCSISRVQNDVGSTRRFFNQELCEVFNQVEKSPPIRIEFGGPFSSSIIFFFFFFLATSQPTFSHLITH